jgi:hypothetical protein
MHSASVVQLEGQLFVLLSGAGPVESVVFPLSGKVLPGIWHVPLMQYVGATQSVGWVHGLAVLPPSQPLTIKSAPTHVTSTDVTSKCKMFQGLFMSFFLQLRQQ